MKNLKQIITGLITTGKASLKEIAFFLGHKRHDKVWREIREMGNKGGYMTMVKMALKMLREREGMEIHLVIDDTVLDKQWGRKTEWAYYLYSGRYGKVIRGIGMVVLMVRVGEWKIPIGFRIYRRKEDGKTRIDLAMEMLRWAIEEEGIRPDAVEMDSWYASRKILKYLLGKGITFHTSVKRNRKVKAKGLKLKEGAKVKKGWVSVEDVDIPEEGVEVDMKGVGKVKLFLLSEPVKNGGKERVKYMVSSDDTITKEGMLEMRKIRWSIEEVFKVLKDVFRLSAFFVRKGLAILGLITVAFIGYLALEPLRVLRGITPYEVRRRLRRMGSKAIYSSLISLPL